MKQWSKKHKCCIKCGKTDVRHRGKGLCRKCYDVNRDKFRKVYKYIDNTKRRYAQRILIRLKPPEEWHNISQCLYDRKYRLKNKELISLKKRLERRLKANKPCLQIIINGETKYFPFEGIDKPKTTTSSGRSIYKKRLKEFTILKNYYLGVTK